MRTNRTWVHRVLRAAAISVLLLLPVSGIATDPSVNTQLLRPTENGSLEQIKTLLAQGADVNPKIKDRSTVFLMVSAELGELSAVKLFIDRGADVNAEAKDGNTVLSFAGIRSTPEIVQYLKAHGAK